MDEHKNEKLEDIARWIKIYANTISLTTDEILEKLRERLGGK